MSATLSEIEGWLIGTFRIHFFATQFFDYDQQKIGGEIIFKKEFVTEFVNSYQFGLINSDQFVSPKTKALVKREGLLFF